MEAATALQGGETFLQEFCTRAPFTGGPDAVYRAVLGESAVTLGDRSMVLRWIHSAGPLAVGRGSALGGRVSSDSSVLLGRETTFERIGAPVIRTEGPGRQFGVAEPESPGDPGPALPPEARKIGDHTRVDGDLAVPAGAAIDGRPPGGHGLTPVGPRGQGGGECQGARRHHLGAGESRSGEPRVPHPPRPRCAMQRRRPGDRGGKHPDRCWRHRWRSGRAHHGFGSNGHPRPGCMHSWTDPRPKRGSGALAGRPPRCAFAALARCILARRRHTVGHGGNALWPGFRPAQPYLWTPPRTCSQVNTENARPPNLSNG